MGEVLITPFRLRTSKTRPYGISITTFMNSNGTQTKCLDGVSRTFKAMQYIPIVMPNRTVSLMINYLPPQKPVAISEISVRTRFISAVDFVWIATVVLP